MSESSEDSEDSNSLPNEEDSNPCPNEEDSNPFPDEDDSNPFPDEDDSNPFPDEEDTNQLPMDEDTNPLPTDNESNPVATEDDTNPLPEGNKRVLRQTNKNAAESTQNSSGNVSGTKTKNRNKENGKKEGFIRLATPISNAIMKVYLNKLELMKQNASATELENCDTQMKTILETAKQKREAKKKERLNAIRERQTNNPESGDMDEKLPTPIVKVEDVVCKIKVIKEEDENKFCDSKIVNGVKDETLDEDFEPMPRPKKRERSHSSDSTSCKEEETNVVEADEDESKDEVNLKQRKSRKRERSESTERAANKEVNSGEMVTDANDDNPSKLHVKSSKKARSASPENMTLIKKEELHIMDEVGDESDKEASSDCVTYKENNLSTVQPSVYESEKRVCSENLIYKEEPDETPVNTISNQSNLQTFSDPRLVVKIEPVSTYGSGGTTKLAETTVQNKLKSKSPKAVTETSSVEINPKQPRKRGRPPSLNKSKSNTLNDTSVTSLTPEISSGELCNSEVVPETKKRGRIPSSAKKGRVSSVAKSDDTIDSVQQSKSPRLVKETRSTKSVLNSECDGETVVKPISRGRCASVKIVDGGDASKVTPLKTKKKIVPKKENNRVVKQQGKKESKSSSCESQVSSSSDTNHSLSKPTLEQKLTVNDLKSLADKIANALRKNPATNSKPIDQEPKKCMEDHQESPPVSGSGSGIKDRNTVVKVEDETNEDYELPDLDEIEFDGLFESYKKDNKIKSATSNLENDTDIVTIDSSDEDTSDFKNDIVVEYKMYSKNSCDEKKEITQH